MVTKKAKVIEDNIELTVALPMYRAEHIAWLALESLCRQKNIDFGWELIIIEEAYECFSEENLNIYKKRLENNGCKRIFYKQLKDWIPLYRKWKMISKEASDSSKAFLLQAADCYSQPYRLRETYDLMVIKGYDFVASPVGPFYDIIDDLLTIYNKRKGIAGLNMAIKPNIVKNIADSNKSRGVDTAIVRATKKWCEDNKKPFNHIFNNSDNWKYGVNTNGLNNISFKRLKQMKEISRPFYRPICRDKSNLTIYDIIPKDIADRLKECKQYCRREFIQKSKSP